MFYTIAGSYRVTIVESKRTKGTIPAIRFSRIDGSDARVVRLSVEDFYTLYYGTKFKGISTQSLSLTDEACARVDKFLWEQDMPGMPERTHCIIARMKKV